MKSKKNPDEARTIQGCVYEHITDSRQYFKQPK